MENLRKRLNGKAKGFTLVELLVVIAIIAILSVTAYVALGGQTAKARNARRQQDLATIQNAVQLYAIEHNNLVPKGLKDLMPEFMLKVPLDPSAPKDTVATYGSTDNNSTVAEDYHYAYAANSKSFQLGATLEDTEDIEKYKAYVIGSASTDLILATPAPAPASCEAGSKTSDGDADCVPVNIWE